MSQLITHRPLLIVLAVIALLCALVLAFPALAGGYHGVYAVVSGYHGAISHIGLPEVKFFID